MAMIKCPECGADISDKSKKCIKCNYVLNSETKSKGITKKKIVLLSVVISVIAILIIFFILVKGVFIKVNINADTIEAGDVVKVSDVIEPAFGFAHLEDADSIVNTQIIGKISIPYVVKCFGFSTSRNLEIEVVDTKCPVIEGPDTLVVTSASDIDWGNLYTVDDFTPDLESKIMPEGSIPTAEGVYDIVLAVEDASGNIGTKQIEIEILKPTREEKVALQFLDELADRGEYKKDEITKLRMYSTDNAVYFIEVNGKEIYYYDPDTNDLLTFDAAALIAGYYSERESYKILLGMLLVDVDITRVQSLMQ